MPHLRLVLAAVFCYLEIGYRSKFAPILRRDIFPYRIGNISLCCYARDFRHCNKHQHRTHKCATQKCANQPGPPVHRFLRSVGNVNSFTTSAIVQHITSTSTSPKRINSSGSSGIAFHIRAARLPPSSCRSLPLVDILSRVLTARIRGRFESCVKRHAICPNP